MNIFKAVAVCAIVAAATSAAMAQERDTVSNRDVLAQPVFPAPENGNIIIRFGESIQVYFKKPFKVIRLGDPLTVTAVPKSDHIIAFTGLAPGTSDVVLEANDGTRTTWGVVTIVRQQHEVKVYVPVPKQQGNIGSTGPGGVTIVNQTNQEPYAADTPSAEYRSVLCNEVGCQPVPKPAK